jgi:hypothetical protein
MLAVSCGTARHGCWGKSQHRPNLRFDRTLCTGRHSAALACSATWRPVQSAAQAWSLAPETRRHGVATGFGSKTMNETRQQSAESFLSRMKRGEFSLARAFWVNFVLVLVIFNVFLSFVESPLARLGLMLWFLLYAVPALKGVWYSAASHNVSAVVRVLARATCVFYALVFLVGAFRHVDLAIQNAVEITLRGTTASDS